MYRTIALVVMLAVAGCAPQNVMQMFDRDPYFEKAMEHLQTGTMVRQFETKAVMHTVYLNGVDSAKYSNDEHFFISVYIANDFYEDETKGLFNPNYTLKLNGQAPLSITLLEDEDPLRKSMPLSPRWSNYYWVRFAKQSTPMVLELSHPHYGVMALTYQKALQ
ncbi:MAG: hypothetical protein KU37_10495 [Sulfuricurvum sp. PC08-66]|nr:MAG: hypothetical protein KU37_10495 [Sulfuricurvum sp. PC08-66]